MGGYPREAALHLSGATASRKGSSSFHPHATGHGEHLAFRTVGRFIALKLIKFSAQVPPTLKTGKLGEIQVTEVQNRQIALYFDGDVLARASGEEIAALTDAATRSTYYRDGLSSEQIAAIRRIVDISVETCAKAADSGHQFLVGAFIDGKLGGFLISTRHADDNREIDWMMVHPSHHGLGVGAALMRSGIEWLDATRPQWLNVVAHNERAISFYRKFGFEIDGPLTPPKAIDQWIMRRPAGVPLS